VKISSRETGQGPVLILLHGYAGSVLHWKPLVSSLESHFRVVVVNYGHLYLGRQALSFTEQVDILGNWIAQSFPNQKVHVAGLSFGGALTWGLGLEFPNLIEKTIFINPMSPAPANHFHMKSMRFFFKIPLSRKSVFLFLSTSMGEKFLKKSAEIFRLQSESVTGRLTGLEGKKKIFIAHLFNNFAWILKQENWRIWDKKLALWNHPSLIIYDPMDPLFKRQSYGEFAQLLQCTEVMQIPDAGHIAIHGEPDKIATSMKEFLQKDLVKTSGRVA
jgi:pimeloyl-ACP methyl ester carboxylesterase